MRIGVDNALGLAPDALRLRAQRTDLLASNLANADTPGYKARDIDFHAVLQQARSSASSPAAAHVTHMQHMSFDNDGGSGEGNSMYRVPLMPALDGNTVDTQLEQAQFAENSTQFLTALRILNGRISGLMGAIKGE